MNLQQRWDLPKLQLGWSLLTSPHYLDLGSGTGGGRLSASPCRLAGDKGAEGDTGIRVVLAAFHLFGLDLGGGALATEEPRLGLTFGHLVLALHVYVGFAHAALDTLA